MRVAVVNNGVPFLRGGAEHLADALVQHLRRRGHEAVSIVVPFRWETPEAVLESIFACFALRIPAVDRVIALKFPAYYVPHDNKVLWLLHQFRQVYDFWGSPFAQYRDDVTGRRLREIIRRADDRALAPLKIYTNSHVTGDRLRQFNGIASSVLYPPLLEDGHFHCAQARDYLFYPSRVNATKRQMLAIEAMAYTTSGVKLIIAGAAEEPLNEAAVRDQIAGLGVSDRVTYIAGFIEEQEKARLFASALGCVYIPFDEDSYGYVTLESFASRKPVITATDSGGTSIVVRNGETGFITDPTPRALARAFDALHSDPERAAAMGTAGHALVKGLGIHWDHVVRALTS